MTRLRIYVAGRDGDYVPNKPYFFSIQNNPSNAHTSAVDLYQPVIDSSSRINIAEKGDIYQFLVEQYWIYKNNQKMQGVGQFFLEGTRNNLQEEKQPVLSGSTQDDQQGNANEQDYIGFYSTKKFLNLGGGVLKTDAYHSAAFEMLDKRALEKLGYEQISNQDPAGEEGIFALVENFDMVVPKGFKAEKGANKNNQAIRNWYKNNFRTHIADFDRMLETVKKVQPKYVQSLENYLHEGLIYPFYSFIMKQTFFNEFSEFLFACLFEYEKGFDLISDSSHTTSSIIDLTNHLLGIYLEHYKERYGANNIKYTDCAYIESMVDPYPQPAFSANNCCIVLSSSNEYVPFAGIAIQSILDNMSSDNYYDIIILDTGIIKANRDILQKSIAGHPNFSLRFLLIKDAISERGLPTLGHITTGTFGRYLTIDYLVNYEKIVYLDSDLVVDDDVHKLGDVDLGNNLVAAVRDTVMLGWRLIQDHPMHDHCRDVIGMTEPNSYFNAGVLVMNLEAWRDYVTCDELLRVSRDKKWKWLDQDVLNHYSRGRVLFLDQAWNYMAHKETAYFPNAIPENWLPVWLKKEYALAREHPKIIHYAGSAIPCYHLESDCHWYFWKYARRSPFFYEPVLKILSDSEQTDYKKLAKGRISRALDLIAPEDSRRRELIRVITRAVYWRDNKNE